MATLTKKNIYDTDVYDACLQRLDALTADAQPEWGKMTPAQMLAHCAEIQEVFNGKPLENTPFIVKLFKGSIRKIVVGDKPYAKNNQTHPQYRITDGHAFEAEKTRLLSAMTTFRETDPAQHVHVLFGPMTREEKGWAVYKHLDHHLQQFGV